MQGKVKEIRRTTGSQKPDLVFNYDGLGNRVSKTVIPKNSVNSEDSITTYYVRDAQGNILATYEKTKYKNGDEKFYLKEQYLYGSTRIGMNVSNQLLASNINGSVEIKEYDGYFTKTVGNKRYALTNHLGNVLAVVSDKKLPDNEPDVISVSDYYPFGMQMPGRLYSNVDYRFGFNQAEKIDEISSIGNTYDLGARLYSPRLGRPLTIDPRASEYAWQSSYAYYMNSPIWQIDYKGEGAPAAPVAVGIVDVAFIATGVVTTGVVLQKSSSGDIELTAGAKSFVNQTLIMGAIMVAHYANLLGITKDNPGYKEQQKREREAKAKANQTGIAHDKMVQDNVGTVSPDGTPNPKGDPNNNRIGKGLLIGGGTAIGIRVGMEITNPDPSKDASEAHQEEAKKRLEEKQQKKDLQKGSDEIIIQPKP